jgi:anti-anti-sigma factor
MDRIDAVPPGEIDFSVETPEAGMAVVAIVGDLDLASVDRLGAAIEPLLASGLERLILEVGELRFADSSAIALWVQWSTRVREIELRNPSALLRRVITTMGLAERLKVTP